MYKKEQKKKRKRKLILFENVSCKVGHKSYGKFYYSNSKVQNITNSSINQKKIKIMSDYNF